MFTEILPFYFVLDKKLIKIFTLQFLELEIDNAEMVTNQDGSTPNSHNNSIDMDDENLDQMTGGNGTEERLLSGGNTTHENSAIIQRTLS
jgi:hypothetical protein